jgi:hypothetical protein
LEIAELSTPHELFEIWHVALIDKASNQAWVHAIHSQHQYFVRDTPISQIRRTLHGGLF